MKKIFIMLLVSTIFFISCKYGSGNIFYEKSAVDSRIERLTDLNAESLIGSIENLGSNPTENYSFLILTDIHFGSIRMDAEDLPLDDFWNWMDQKRASSELPSFCMILGDNIDYRDENFLSEYLSFTSKLKDEYALQVFNVIGNHDLYQEGYDMWKDNTNPGTDFYTFHTNDYSFYCLDSASGCFGQKQVKLLKDAFVLDNRPKFVFSHYPLYTNFFYVCIDDTTERNLLINLFTQNKVRGYFNGHIHKIETTDLGAFSCYSVPSLRFRQKWTLVTVNSSTHDFTIEYIN